jgi:hypothetical protein
MPGYFGAVGSGGHPIAGAELQIVKLDLLVRHHGRVARLSRIPTVDHDDAVARLPRDAEEFAVWTTDLGRLAS